METDVQRARVLSDRLVAARSDQRRAEHRLARLLAELADADLHHALGYASVGEYAAEVLDLCPRQARELVRLGRSLPGLPILDAVLESGALDWTKARELLRVVTPETEGAWVGRARQVTSRVLERDVAASIRGQLPPDGPPARERAPERVRLVFELEAADADVLRQALAVLRARSDLSAEEVEDGALLAGMARRIVGEAEPAEAPTGERYRIVIDHCPSCLANASPSAEASDTIVAEAMCDAEVLDARPGPSQGHVSRTIPPATRRMVLVRAGWACEVPGCDNRLWLDVHHVRHRARGGGHDVGNLAVLCCAHHRAVHAGGLAVERLANGAMSVTHADGRRRVGRATHVGREPCGVLAGAVA
jgi:hypothetical protein